MTTIYGPVGAFPTTGSTANATAGTTSGSSTSAKKDPNAVDTDMFLKLLVAQMKYQDPSNAMDPSQFLSQSAQFSTVEKLATLEKLAQQAYESSRQQTATSMIGQTVTYRNVSGETRTGVVTGVSVGASTPNVTVDGISVCLDDVSAVSSTPATTTTTPATTTTTPATTTAG